MKVKKLLAGVLAGTLVLGSLAVVSADEEGAEDNLVMVSGDGLELDVTTGEAFTISLWVNTAQKINYQPIIFTNIDDVNYVTAGTNYNDFASGGIVDYKTTWYWLDQNTGCESTLKDLPLDTWTYITLTMTEDGTAKLYYNAETLSTQVISDYEEGYFKDCPIFLGVNWWDASFCGLMDDVAVYDSALTLEEVTELYEKSGVPDKDADNLIAYYTFDQTLKNEVGEGSASVHGGSGDTWGNGPISSEPTYNENGVNGYAYEFLGNQEVVSETEPDVEGSGGGTKEVPNAEDNNTVIDEYTLEDQYCDGWWTTFSQAIELVEGTKTVITGVTNSGDAAPYTDEYGNLVIPAWLNAIYVLYSSDDGNVYSTNKDDDRYEAGLLQNYTEYFIGRVDNYGWGVVDFTVLSAPDDWESFLAATNEGAEFTIEALYVDGTIQITCTCLGASYVMTYAVEDPDTPIYLALTGENCQLSDLSVVVYKASEGGIVNVGEPISGAGEPVDDGDASAAAAAAVSGVKTADASLLLLIVLALAGCSAIAFVAKKRA